MPLTEVFAQLGLRQAASTAIDVAALLAAVEGEGSAARRVRETVAEAVCGMLAALVALSDPEVIVLGGPWGSTPAVLEAVRARFAAYPRPVPLRAPRVEAEPALTGARSSALDELRAAVIATARDGGDAARIAAHTEADGL